MLGERINRNSYYQTLKRPILWQIDTYNVMYGMKIESYYRYYEVKCAHWTECETFESSTG